MIVRDEEARIASCLASIHDLFDEIAVVDTGSRDATREILRHRFGITALQTRLHESECLSKAAARNLSYEALGTPWILSLDADERISRQDLMRLIAAPEPEAEGLFLRWVTDLGGDFVDDYKLAIFRRGASSRGRVHENMQPSFRALGWQALWQEGAVLAHAPDLANLPAKRAFYRRRLVCALAHEPQCTRYHWFLGYGRYCAGDLAGARDALGIAAASCSREFPVECLNASLVLLEVLARLGDGDALRAALTAALEFYAQVAEDFDVVVNFRWRAWMADAGSLIEAGQAQGLRAYRFAY